MENFKTAILDTTATTERHLHEKLYEELRHDLKKEFKKLKVFILTFAILIVISFVSIEQLFDALTQGGVANWLLFGWFAFWFIFYGKLVLDEIK